MLIEGHTSIYCMSGKQFKSVDFVSKARVVIHIDSLQTITCYIRNKPDLYLLLYMHFSAISAIRPRAHGRGAFSAVSTLFIGELLARA
jgi:hypothetical protein